MPSSIRPVKDGCNPIARNAANQIRPIRAILREAVSTENKDARGWWQYWGQIGVNP
jgi:hypothetical protein